MIGLSLIAKLKEALANVLASVELNETKTDTFKDEVVANAGGVVPMFLWEYHTRMDAYRHKLKVSDAFIAEGIPYGLSGSSWINLITQTQLSQVEIKHITTLREEQEAATAALAPLIENVWLVGRGIQHHPSINIQPVDQGIFFGIDRMGYFLTDGEITRGIRFDEPYYVSYTTNFAGGDVGFITSYNFQKDHTVLDRNSTIINTGVHRTTYISSFIDEFCKVLYAPPYCYLVFEDRTVKYHVDNA